MIGRQLQVVFSLTLLFAICAVSRAAEQAKGADKHDSGHPCVDGFQRAGNPQCVAWYAICSDRPLHIGYYVGGGTLFEGDAPCADEGTWGWDYFGYWVFRQVDLGWSHGRRRQGGTGAYKTDGPKLHHAE